MLFSNPQVAAYINNSFEPVWQKVREVPQITVDFGNGKVIKRTLHGNIATYVCTSSGQVVDILPGIYKADQYQGRLTEIAAVAAKLEGKSTAVLASYHENEAQRLDSSKNIVVHKIVQRPARKIPMVPDVSKLGIERRTEVLLQPMPEPVDLTARTQAGPLGSWDSLAMDTALNESQRRRQIHQKLATGVTTPAAITRWLYREVLHADLDDPYLGLGPSLFSGYPFPEQS